MADLSHWDFAIDFSGREAAFLIMGVDPSNADTDRHNPNHIIGRMKVAYEGSIRQLKHDIFVTPCFNYMEIDEPPNAVPDAEMLTSVKAFAEIEFCRTHGTAKRLEGWLEYGGPNFFDQKFSRPEIIRWLNAVGLSSVYRFGSTISSDAQCESKSVERPLATTERNTLLIIIAALCDYSAIDHQGRGVARQISDMTDTIGASVTDDTIRSILSKIPLALMSRSK